MKFGPVPLADATGAILAHSIALPKGRLRKGRILTPDDIATLTAAGHATVTVARLDAQDIHEDVAATRLATALAGPGLRLGPAGTGRVNLFAEAPGLARIDAAAIGAVNAVDPMITTATVPRWHRMGQGGMVATVKIISYAVPEAALAEACTRAENALSLQTPQLSTVALIQTTTPGDDGAKGHEAMETRLAALGLGLPPKTIVPHETDALATALKATRADLILILTASATSDIADVAPAAVTAAGGRIEHFGMPVDPGNLLFLGTLGGAQVIGLPGCARSPALNGADWVLERLICGVPVTSADIAGMGVGGLLKEIPTRPQPRNPR